MTEDHSGRRYAGAARFGPFFTVDDVRDVSLGWAPVAALAEPTVLMSRVRLVSAALAAGLPDGYEVPIRVAASVMQLGLCARLSAVALGAAVDGLPLPMTTELVYVDQLGGPYPLAFVAQGSEHAIRTWPEALLELVAPIAEATIATFGLSAQVVWGNVASGINGAAQMIGALDLTVNPGLAAVADQLTDLALSHGRLKGTMTTGGSTGGQAVRRRRSCCLIYRLAGSTSAVCGDCVLTAR